MKFFTIIATIFCGGIVWVGADYYIEFQGHPTVTDSRGRTSLTNYLYSCRGIPDGTPAYAAVGSACDRVESWDDRINIYFTHNFYSAFRSNLQGHTIHFYDRGYIPLTEWNIGYSSDNIDHPNFAEPAPEDVAYFRDNLDQLGAIIVQPQTFSVLAQYFAQTNIIALAENPDLVNSLFYRFDAFLMRITQRYHHLMEDPNSRGAATLRAMINHAMRMALQKLLDPCFVLRGHLQIYASNYCLTYCNFLDTVGQYFRTCASSCSSLRGGRCERTVCMCNRVLNQPFQGCDTNRMTSPMKLCHNNIRRKLHL